MAFEDGLGTDPSQQRDENYALSAYDIIATTIKLWYRKIIHYIIIVGVISSLTIGLSFVLLLLLFGTTGTIGVDPFTYFVNIFLGATLDIQVFVVSIAFAFFAFIINAIVLGAAIKFTLDEYGGLGGDIGASFSHSIGRVIPVIIVQIILSFLTAIILTPATYFLNQAISMVDITDMTNPIIPPEAIQLMLTGFALFAIGGLFLIFISVKLTPVLAIVIDTDLSAVDSLKKSWKMTSGNFLHIFGSYVLLNVVIVIISVAMTFVLGFIALPLDTLLVIDTVLTALLISPLPFIFTAVIYRDLASRFGEKDDESLPSFIG